MAQRAGKRTTRSADLRRRALDLRVAGATYEQIGLALALSTTAAYGHVQKALDESRTQTKESADKVRATELRRLDGIVMALWPKRSDPRFADSILRAMERRSRLLGLDAPLKSKSEVVGADGGPIRTKSEIEVKDVLGAATEERTAAILSVLARVGALPVPVGPGSAGEGDHAAAEQVHPAGADAAAGSVPPPRDP